MKSWNKYLHALRVHGIVLAPILTLVFVSIDTYAFPVESDLRLFLGILLYWMIGGFILRLSARLTFVMALVVFLGMYASFLFRGTAPQTERLATWLFLFLAYGLVQQWRELS